MYGDTANLCHRDFITFRDEHNNINPLNCFWCSSDCKCISEHRNAAKRRVSESLHIHHFKNTRKFESEGPISLFDGIETAARGALAMSVKAFTPILSKSGRIILIVASLEALARI